VDVCEAVGAKLDHHSENILRHLLKLLSQAKKIISNAGANAITTLIKNVSYQLRLLQHIVSNLSQKNVTVRNHCISFIRIIVDLVLEKEHSRQLFEKSGALQMLEPVLKKAVQDASPVVREGSREVICVLLVAWPSFTEK
jgi:CLIP-associating protein 1/2